MKSLPQPVLASLRWPGRPELAARQPGVDLHDRAPAVPLRAVRRPRRERRRRIAFEVWVNGSEQPRGLGAVAKTLSMDMRANDRAGCA